MYQIKINDLLKLNYTVDEFYYDGELKPLRFIGEHIYECEGLDGFVTKHMKDRHYVISESSCYYGRSRSINVLEWKGNPILVYNYIGKGYYEDTSMLKGYKEFMKDVFEYITDNIESEENETFPVKCYDNEGFKIIDNQLIAY